MSFKNNFKILILISIFLFFGGSVLAANPYFPEEVSFYSRQPGGYKVVLPLDFSVILSEYPADCAGKPFWNIELQSESTWFDGFFPNIASSTLTLEKEVSGIGFERYDEVGLWCYDEVASTTGATWVGMLEYDDVFQWIFEVGENYYLNIGTGFATGTLAYAGDLFTDLELVIILAVGLPVGFWTIKKIIALLR